MARKPRRLVVPGLVVDLPPKRPTKSIVNTATRTDEEKQRIATPWCFIHALEQRFGTPVDFDLAADKDNTKAESFIDAAEDSLSRNWSYLQCRPDGAVVRLAFLNPPFANIAPWARKLASCRWLPRWTVMLAPASFSCDWFMELADKVQRDAIPRIQFDGQDIVFPKDLALFVAGFGMVGGGGYWDWRVDYRKYCLARDLPCLIGGKPWPSPKARLVPTDNCLPDLSWNLDPFAHPTLK